MGRKCYHYRLDAFASIFQTKILQYVREVIITINVPLFKKLRDIIFFWRDNNFLSRFEGHFVGAKTFLTP